MPPINVDKKLFRCLSDPGYRQNVCCVRPRSGFSSAIRFQLPITNSTYNPAVQPPPRPAAGLRSTTSNCSADHPPGDNRFFRKQLRPKAGSRLTRRQPPVLGSREKRNSAPEGRPLLLGLILRALCVARPGAKTRGQQDGPSSVAPSSTSQSSRPCPHAGRRVSPLR